MTNEHEQAKKMLKAKLECLKRETSGTDFDCNNSNCDECSLCYEQGNMGEQKEALDMAIKALEQQPCEDTISRQAAIDAIEHRLAEPAYQHTGEDWYVGMNCAESELYELPSAQPEQRWIPCSERLPEVGKDVMVCYDFKGHRSVLIGVLYGDEKFHGYDDEYLTPEGRKYRKAVAWMPLPKPYKAETEREE